MLLQTPVLPQETSNGKRVTFSPRCVIGSSEDSQGSASGHKQNEASMTIAIGVSHAQKKMQKALQCIQNSDLALHGAFVHGI